MTDSNQPDNHKIRLLTSTWQRIVAIWQGILAIHKAIEEGNKIWRTVAYLLFGTSVSGAGGLERIPIIRGRILRP